MQRKPSLFTHVLDRLGAEIVSGVHNGTGLLPREQDLCQLMGASRTVIREVVRVLAQKGMVQPQQKVGVRVLPASTWNLLDIDVLDWIWRGGHYEPYIRDFLEFRLSFEPMASFQAALRATPKAREDIVARYRTLLEMNELLKNGGDRQQAIDVDIGFHTAVFSASGNHLAQYLGALVAHMMRLQVWATTDAPGEFARGLHLHGDVAAAIMEGRAADAFNSSFELVRMPYEIYMRKSFPSEPLVLPGFSPTLSSSKLSQKPQKHPVGAAV